MPVKVDRSIFYVDEDDVAKDWVEQPGFVYDHGFLLATARKAYETAKNRLEVTEAELSHKIRSVPEDYGVEKVTEKVVEMTIVLQKEYRVARQNLIDAEFDVDVLKAAMAALSDKREALKARVQMQGMETYAEPKMRQANDEVRREADRQRKKAIRRKGDR